jgi:hypothetical protein
MPRPMNPVETPVRQVCRTRVALGFSHSFGKPFVKGLYKAALRFSRRPELNGLWQDIEKKIVQKFSMGVEILAGHEIKADGQTTVRLADKWRPFEISIAPLPADFGTTTLSADQMLGFGGLTG